MPRRRLLTAILLCCAPCLAAPLAQAAPAWQPALTISNPFAAPVGIEPVVTMGPSGDIAAAWWESGNILTAVRLPGAAAFSQQTVSTPGDKSAYPSVAVSASGAIAVAWIDETAEQYEVAVRLPGATSFSAPVEAGPTGGSLTQETPVAIDDAGDVLLGEIQATGGGNSLIAYAWQPAGGTFTVTPATVSTSNLGDPVVAMDGAGDAIVAWYDNVGTAHTIARAITRPAGGAFGSTQTLTNGAEYAFSLSVAMGSGGQAAVVWQTGTTSPPYRVEASTSAGPTDLLTLPQTISPASSNDEYPAVGVGGNGEAVAAWEQQGETDSEAVASATAGGSFDTASTLGEAGTGYPRIATDAAGDALVAWGANPLGGSETVEAVTRTADGALSPETVLSEPGEKIDWDIASNLPAASAGMDLAGDAIVGWERASDHTLQARLYEVGGNSAPGPIVPVDLRLTHVTARTGPHRFACVVPLLRGLSAKAAKRRLQAAGCRLGRASVSRRHRHAKRLVVAAQSFKAGTRLALDAKVAVTLAPAPRHSHRRR